MLLAAELQKEYNVDVSYDLVPLLDKSETFRKYIPLSKAGSEDNKWGKVNDSSVQSRVSYDGQSDRTQEND